MNARAEHFRSEALRALARARQMKANEERLECLPAQVSIARLKWHFYLDVKE